MRCTPSSTRLATPSRTVYYDGAYAAYGENYAETGTQDREFAGMEQDIVSSGSYPLYDALMREYHPTWGRWVSPDPAGLAAANPANPQSWNRYAYVVNNPLIFTDPLGLDPNQPDCGQAPSPYMCGFSFWGGYNGPDSYFTNTWDEFDLLGPTYVDNGEGGLEAVSFPNQAEVVNALEDASLDQPGNNIAILPLSTCVVNALKALTPNVCNGTARVLGPGKLTNGRPGGAFDAVVSAGTAAVIPAQFGLTNSQLRPFIGGIEGYIGGARVPTFTGVSDVIGGSPPRGYANVRDFLEARNAGLFIVELEGGRDMGVEPITLGLPAGLPCPEGTQ